jgi:hypothetical protein
LRDVIQEIITTSTSPPNRCTITPVAEVNLEVDSWTTTCKATTAGSSLGFKDNVCEVTLSSQSACKINSGCPSYKASVAPNPKLLNDFEPSQKQLEKFRGNYGRSEQMRIARKNTLSAIDHQGKTINTNIAKVQAQNVVLWPLHDIESVDWTTIIFLFGRLWFCEDIHHSSILKLAIEKEIQISTNANLSSKLFQDDSNKKKNRLSGLCLHTKRAHC